MSDTQGCIFVFVFLASACIVGYVIAKIIIAREMRKP